MDAGIQSNIRHESPDYYIPAGPAVSPDTVPDLLETSHRMTSLPGVSVVIPTYFNEQLKAGSIHAVLEGIHDAASIRETVLVSTDSEPAARELERNLDLGPLPVRHLACYGSHNRALARNRGAAAATSEFLLFLDDDTILRSWRLIDVILTAVLDGHFDAALYPRRAFLQFPTLFDRGSVSKTLELWKNSESQCLERVYDPVARQSRYKTIRFCFPGNFMLIRSSIFMRLGGFDEDFVGWGFEDADFALRASTSSRVLNLFHRVTPLLHVDHPTTPYKSDEHKANYGRFRTRFTSMDLDLLCDRVITGRNFEGESSSRDASAATYAHSLASTFRAFDLPGQWAPLLNRFQDVIRRRLEEGWDAEPRWIILHGSRGAGISSVDGDFDILILFHGGVYREFYVDDSGRVKLEVEFSDIGKFEDICSRPSSFPIGGPLELAKLANGWPLWGDTREWHLWSRDILDRASSAGTLYWLVVALGLRLQEEKLGPIASRFSRYLRDILRNSVSSGARDAADALADADIRRLAQFVAKKLATEHPEWKQVHSKGSPLFPNQIPESWLALSHLRNLKA